ncbi:MAG: ComF family protein [Chitinophagaceae bacterium]|nr:ComF family protein [Chitinophagaceae bacterium]
MSGLFRKISQSIVQLFYPNVCAACGTQLLGDEKVICTTCWHDFPETDYHLHDVNPVEEKCRGRFPFRHATAMYYFNKETRIQQALHHLKYRGETEVGKAFGQHFGRALLQSSWVNEIDVIVPVPLSDKKLKERGYNQSACIAEGISEVTGIPVDTKSLRRVKHTATQTHKSRSERMNNVANAFALVPHHELANKHVLLVDDVITTGATLESSAKMILTANQSQISIATLAYAID